MNDPEASNVFAAVDGRTDTELPDWYRRTNPDDDPTSFAAAVRDLSQAVETTVAYQNPYPDEWVETERFNALVEPNRARSQAREADAESDPLFLHSNRQLRDHQLGRCLRPAGGGPP
jgi:hypothetical protein